MQIFTEKMVSIYSDKFLHTMFPGGCRLTNGDVLLIMVEGSGFESSDQQLLQARSKDQGISWQLEETALSDLTFSGVQPFTPTVKPTLLPNGELLAAGYGFHREHPEMGLSDYAEKYGHFPACSNILLHSADHGKSWQVLPNIRHQYDGLELSGPLMVLPDGKLLVFAAPFLLNAPLQRGIVLESCDGGMSWQEKSTFWESPSIAPWEIRSIRLGNGRIMLVLWAFDLKNNRHLPNHIVVSEDNGRTWLPPINTGLPGQASNFLFHDGKIGILQARREGDNPGIFLSDIAPGDNNTVKILDEYILWDAKGMCNAKGRIEKQFANLKFGQPSVLFIDDGKYLLIFWSFMEDHYAVRTIRFQF